MRIGRYSCFLLLIADLLVTRVGAAGENPSSSVGTGELPARPPGPAYPLQADDHRDVPTFTEGQPIVATTYFYWYDVQTGAHIVDPDGSDALTTHPADMEGLSYKRVDWHREQLRDMIDAGIDVVLPVFWGYPGDYETHWSYVGLPPLIRAHEDLTADGHRPPAIGLFYDTSSLHHNRFRGRPTRMDLTTELGKDWFYTTIRDYFSMVPPRKWARIDGRPIVFLYSASFAKAQDPRQLDYVRRRFARDFGCGLYLVRHQDWQGQADAWYSWGGALALKLGDSVAGIGPGYDHSAVPGRSPLIVDRRGGEFYRENWRRLLSMDPSRRPFLVHIETWNEWHEGTDIAHSREYGRKYIELTRRFADKFHRRERLPRAGRYANATQVTWRVGAPAGLRLRESRGDGLWTTADVAGTRAVTPRAHEFGRTRYLYFAIDDSFLFDEEGAAVSVVVRYVDKGCERFGLEYDNTNEKRGPMSGAFRPAGMVVVGQTRTLKTTTFELTEARFANRCNEADFRLVIEGQDGELPVASVAVSRGDH